MDAYDDTPMAVHADLDTSGGERPIKQEPCDDALTYDVVVPATTQYSLFMSNASTERILAASGNKSPTICFEDAFLQHPHHHRLSCGHDILTNTPEA
jgi:hypothetical protein